MVLFCIIKSTIHIPLSLFIGGGGGRKAFKNRLLIGGRFRMKRLIEKEWRWDPSKIGLSGFITAQTEGLYPEMWKSVTDLS